MNYKTFEEVACGRISDLVDQLHTLQSRDDVVSMAVVNAELRDLTAALDNDDPFFFSTDHRYLV